MALNFLLVGILFIQGCSAYVNTHIPMIYSCLGGEDDCLIKDRFIDTDYLSTSLGAHIANTTRYVEFSTRLTHIEQHALAYSNIEVLNLSMAHLVKIPRSFCLQCAAQHVILPESVTYIDTNAFHGTQNDIFVRLPLFLQILGDHNKVRTQLDEFSLPRNMWYMGTESVGDANKITFGDTMIHFQSNDISSLVIDGTNTHITEYVIMEGSNIGFSNDRDVFNLNTNCGNINEVYDITLQNSGDLFDRNKCVIIINHEDAECNVFNDFCITTIQMPSQHVVTEPHTDLSDNEKLYYAQNNIDLDISFKYITVGSKMFQGTYHKDMSIVIFDDRTSEIPTAEYEDARHLVEVDFGWYDNIYVFEHGLYMSEIPYLFVPVYNKIRRKPYLYADYKNILNNNVYTNCDTGCSECYTDSCPAANDGFYLVGGKPEACAEGCKRCDATGCVVPKTSYRLIEGTNITTACAAHCRQCNANECTEHGHVLRRTQTNNITIHDEAFYNAGSGAYKFTDAVTHIGNKAFSNIVLMTEDIRADYTHFIGDSAFENTNVKNIHFEGVNSIGNDAFAHNMLLENCYIKSLADSFAWFGHRVFYGAKASHVMIEGNIQTLYPNTFEKSLIETLYIIGRVDIIKEATFENMVHLREMVVRGGTTRIEDDAFLNSPVENVLLEGVKYVGNNSFENTYLSTFDFSSVEEIGIAAFKNTPLSGEIEFPTTLRTIGASAFEHTHITKVVINAGITTIGKNAFRGTRMLREANIPPTIIMVPSGLFESSALELIQTHDNIHSIGKRAFANTDITSFYMPAKLKHILDGAFMNSKLEHIDIPRGVTYIGMEAFRENVLTTVNIQGQIRYIHNNTFYKNRLTHVTLPTSLKYIGPHAFAANYLSSVQLPYSLEAIKSRAFAQNAFNTVYVSPTTDVDNTAFIYSSTMENTEIRHCYKNDTNCIFACDPNCAECDGFFCSAAKSGFYISEKQPSPCIEGCDLCNDSYSCIEAAPGYFMDDSTLYPCMNHCANCTSHDTCIEPESGFYIDVYANVSVVAPCGEYCTSCENTTQCTALEEHYYFKQPKARRCEDGCDRCYASNCLDPSPGYRLEPKIASCSEGCDDCRHSMCLDAAPGYFINNRSFAKACDIGCAECASGLCTATLDGYILVDDQPHACATGCKTCTTDDICLELLEGYTYYNDTTYCGNGCLSCNETHCFQARAGYNLLGNGEVAITCEEGCKRCSTIECLEAKDGYYLQQWWTGQGYTLYRCEDNCKRCNSNGYCIEADEGYTLVDGIPTPEARRRLSNIFRFDLFRYGYGCDAFDSTGCIDPMDGHRISINITSCEENCAACDLEKCTRAKDGFRLVNDVPQACVDGCKNCEDGTCTETFDGFYMVNNVPHACEDGCSECDATSCFRLKNGYFYSNQHRVAACVEGCAECNVTHCISLKDGFVWNDDGTIYECPDNCKICTTSGVCTEPMLGYRLDGQNIVQCPMHCDICEETSNSDIVNCIQSSSGRSLVETEYLGVVYNISLPCQDDEYYVDGKSITKCEVCSHPVCTKYEPGYERVWDIPADATPCSERVVAFLGDECTVYLGNPNAVSCDTHYFAPIPTTTTDPYLLGLTPPKMCCENSLSDCTPKSYRNGACDVYNVDCYEGAIGWYIETDAIDACDYECKTCNETYCFEPADGYYFDNIQPCEQGCNSCDEHGCLDSPVRICEHGCKNCTENECLEAMPGYVIHDTDIYSCMEGCSKCDEYFYEDGTFETWWNAKPPYHRETDMTLENAKKYCMNDAQCVSFGWAEHQQVFFESDDYLFVFSGSVFTHYVEQCEIPKSGYYINQYSKTEACQDGCSECDSSHTCIIPMPGFYIDNAGDMKQCQTGCNVCDDSTCFEAVDGYFLNMGSLEMCTTNCKRCDADECLEANEGFFIKQNTFSPCPSYAKSCTSPLDYERHTDSNITIYQRVVAIEPNAFRHTNVLSITIPNEVKIIGENAFAGSSLHTINMPEGVEKIGANAFKSTSIEYISLPESLTEIGEQAFFNTPLTNITLPSTLQVIGDNAFAFTHIQYVDVAEDVFVGRGAFDSLEDIYINMDGTYFPGLVNLYHPNFMHALIKRLDIEFLARQLDIDFVPLQVDTGSFSRDPTQWSLRVEDEDFINSIDGDVFLADNFSYPFLSIYDYPNHSSFNVKGVMTSPHLLRPDAVYTYNSDVYQPFFFTLSDDTKDKWVKIPRYNQYTLGWKKVATITEEITCQTTAKEWHARAFESFMPDDLRNIQFSGKDFRDIVLRGVKMCFPQQKQDKYLFPRPFSCPDGCVCDINRCVAVIPDTPYYYSEGMARRCMTGCDLCYDGNTCRDAAYGYFLSNRVSQACVNGCGVCRSNTTCETAKSGFRLNNATDTPVVPCEPGCDMCTDLKCIRPMSGYRLDDSGAVVSCQENCDICDIYDCLRAKPGYYITATGIFQNQCDEDCELCYNDTSCIQLYDKGDVFYKPSERWYDQIIANNIEYWSRMTDNATYNRIYGENEGEKEVARVKSFDYLYQFEYYINNEGQAQMEGSGPGPACHWNEMKDAPLREQYACAIQNTRHCEIVGPAKCYGERGSRGPELTEPSVMVDPKYPDSDEYMLPCSHGAKIDMRDSTFQDTIGGPTFAMADFDEPDKASAVDELHTWAKILQPIEVKPGSAIYPDLLLGPGVIIDGREDAHIIYEYGAARHIVKTPYVVNYLTNEFKWGSMRVLCTDNPCLIFKDMEIRDADFRGVSFDGSVRFENVAFVNVDFHGASFTEDIFAGASFENVRGNWFGFKTAHPDAIEAYTFSNGAVSYMFWGTSPNIDNTFLSGINEDLAGVTGRYIGDITIGNSYEEVLHYIKPVDDSWDNVKRSDRARNVPFENTMEWYERRADIPFNRVHNLPCLETWKSWFNDTDPIVKDGETWRGNTIEALDGVWGCGHDNVTLYGYKFVFQEIILKGVPTWKCISGDCATLFIENNNRYVNHDLHANHYLNSRLIDMKGPTMFTSDHIFFDVQWENLKSGLFVGSCPQLINSGQCISNNNKQFLLNYRVRLDNHDLSNMDLTGVDLSVAGSLTRVKFNNAILRNVEFGDESLFGCDLSNADFTDTDIPSFDSKQRAFGFVQTSPLQACPRTLPRGYTCYNKHIIGPGGAVYSGTLTDSFANVVKYENVDLSHVTFDNFDFPPFTVTDVLATAESSCPKLPKEYTCTDVYQRERLFVVIGPGINIDCDGKTLVLNIHEYNEHLSFESMTIFNGYVEMRPVSSNNVFNIPSNMENADLSKLSFNVNVQFPNTIYVENLTPPKLKKEYNIINKQYLSIVGSTNGCLHFKHNPHVVTRCVSNGTSYIHRNAEITGNMSFSKVVREDLSDSNFIDFRSEHNDFIAVDMDNSKIHRSYFDSTVFGITEKSSIEVEESIFLNCTFDVNSVVSIKFNDTVLQDVRFEGKILTLVNLDSTHKITINRASLHNTYFGTCAPTIINSYLMGNYQLLHGSATKTVFYDDQSASYIGEDLSLTDCYIENPTFRVKNKSACFKNNWTDVIVKYGSDDNANALPCDNFMPLGVTVSNNVTSLDGFNYMFEYECPNEVLYTKNTYNEDPNICINGDLENYKNFGTSYYICDDDLIVKGKTIHNDVFGTVARVDDHFYMEKGEVVQKLSAQSVVDSEFASCGVLPNRYDTSLISVSSTMLTTMDVGLMVVCDREDNDVTNSTLSDGASLIQYNTSNGAIDFAVHLDFKVRTATIAKSGDTISEENMLLTVLYVCTDEFLYRRNILLDTQDDINSISMNFSTFDIARDLKLRKIRCDESNTLSVNPDDLFQIGFSTPTYTDISILQNINMRMNNDTNGIFIKHTSCIFGERSNAMYLYEDMDWGDGTNINVLNEILEDNDKESWPESFDFFDNWDMRNSITYRNGSFSHMDLTNINQRLLPLHVGIFDREKHIENHMKLPSEILKRIETSNGFTLIGPVVWHDDVNVTANILHDTKHFKVMITEGKRVSWNSILIQNIHIMMNESNFEFMDWTNVVWHNMNVHGYTPDENVSIGHNSITIRGNIHGQMTRCGPFDKVGEYECQDGVFVGPNTVFDRVDCTNLNLTTIYEGMSGQCGCKRGTTSCTRNTCPKISNLPKNLDNPEAPYITTCRNGYIFHPNISLTNVVLSDQNLNGVDATGQSWAKYKLINNRGRLFKCPKELPPLYKCINNYIVGPNADLTDANLRGFAMHSEAAETFEGVKGILYSCPDTLPLGFSCMVEEDPVGFRIIGPNIVYMGNVSKIFTSTVINSYNRRRLRRLTPYANTGRVDFTGTSMINDYGCTNVDLPNGFTCVDNDDKGYIVGPRMSITNFNLSGANLTFIDLRGVSGHLKGTLTCPSSLPPGFICVSDTSNPFAPAKSYIYGPNSHIKMLKLNLLDPQDGSWSLANVTSDDISGSFIGSVCPIQDRLPKDTECRNGVLYGKNVEINAISPNIESKMLNQMYLKLNHNGQDVRYRFVEANNCLDKVKFHMNQCPREKEGHDSSGLDPDETGFESQARRRLNQMRENKINLKSYIHESVFNRKITTYV